MTEHIKEEARRTRKQFIGVVVGNRMQKTARVLVERTVTHPLFKKQVRKRSNFMAHDENNDCKIGDKVLIEETRPLSKLKRWRIVEILEKAK